MIVAMPAANSFVNGRTASIAIAVRAADEQHERGDDADRADEPELLTDRREHVVGRRERDEPRLAEAEAGARDAARTERVPTLHGLEPVRRSAFGHGLVQLSTRTRTWPNALYATTAPMTSRIERADEVRGAPRRHVEHRREHAEEQQRRADVLLVREHEQRHAPREEERTEVARRRDEPAPDADRVPASAARACRRDTPRRTRRAAPSRSRSVRSSAGRSRPRAAPPLMDWPMPGASGSSMNTMPSSNAM